MTGNIAISMAGHDKGHAYIIIKEENGFVYLVDGEIKKLSNPKRKSLKHVRINKQYPTDELTKKLLENDPLYDHESAAIICYLSLQIIRPLDKS